jgi:hypothetical protein
LETSRNVQKLQNLIDTLIPKREEQQSAYVERLENNLIQATERATKVFSRDDEIAKLQARLDELDSILSEDDQKSVQEEIVDDGEEITETKEEVAEREEFNKKFAEEINDGDFVPDMPNVTKKRA